jgi:hypothetical protein
MTITAESLKVLLECWLMETKSIRRSTMRKKIRKLFSAKPKKENNSINHLEKDNERITSVVPIVS